MNEIYYSLKSNLSGCGSFLHHNVTVPGSRKIVLDFVIAHPGASVRDMMDQTRLQPENILKVTAALADAGLLLVEQEGDDPRKGMFRATEVAQSPAPELLEDEPDPDFYAAINDCEKEWLLERLLQLAAEQERIKKKINEKKGMPDRGPSNKEDPGEEINDRLKHYLSACGTFFFLYSGVPGSKAAAVKALAEKDEISPRDLGIHFSPNQLSALAESLEKEGYAEVKRGERRMDLTFVATEKARVTDPASVQDDPEENCFEVFSTQEQEKMNELLARLYDGMKKAVK